MCLKTMNCRDGYSKRCQRVRSIILETILNKPVLANNDIFLSQLKKQKKHRVKLCVIEAAATPYTKQGSQTIRDEAVAVEKRGNIAKYKFAGCAFCKKECFPMLGLLNYRSCACVSTSVVLSNALYISC